MKYSHFSLSYNQWVFFLSNHRWILNIDENCGVIERELGRKTLIHKDFHMFAYVLFLVTHSLKGNKMVRNFNKIMIKVFDKSTYVWFYNCMKFLYLILLLYFLWPALFLTEHYSNSTVLNFFEYRLKDFQFRVWQFGQSRAICHLFMCNLFCF